MAGGGGSACFAVGLKLAHGLLHLNEALQEKHRQTCFGHKAQMGKEQKCREKKLTQTRCPDKKGEDMNGGTLDLFGLKHNA